MTKEKILEIIKKYGLYIGLSLVCFVVGSFVLGQEQSEPTVITQASETLQIKQTLVITEPSSKRFPVCISGEVKNPGVYQMEPDAYLDLLIQMAGGLTESAQIKTINLAMELQPNQFIYIPSLDEEIDMPNLVEDPGSSLININKATEEELVSIPGVGSSTAKAIIKYREQIGSYQTIQDLMQVPGIKAGKFAKMEDYISCK